MISKDYRKLTPERLLQQCTAADIQHTRRNVILTHTCNLFLVLVAVVTLSIACSSGGGDANVFLCVPSI